MGALPARQPVPRPATPCHERLPLSPGPLLCIHYESMPPRRALNISYRLFASPVHHQLSTTSPMSQGTPCTLASILLHELTHLHPTANQPGHVPASARTVQYRAVQPAHPPAPEHSQSQHTGKVPFWCVRSQCRLTSSQGPRGAQSPPWCVLESLGRRSSVFWLTSSRSLHTQPFVPPSGREGGPRAKEGMNHRA